MTSEFPEIINSVREILKRIENMKIEIKRDVKRNTENVTLDCGNTITRGRI